MAKLKLIKSYDEIDTVRTFVFEAGGASWTSGQYQVYELNQVNGGEKAKKRYFTIASSPSEGVIHISTRISDSSFKQALNAMQPGDEIEAHDIDGDFVWNDDETVVLVAGGIGVTPYRSMFIERDNIGKSLPARLLYYGRDENFAFKEEFNQLVTRHPELTIEYIIGESISANSILEHAPEAIEKTVYISGPESMVDVVGKDLKSQGITIKQDWFPGYTNETY